MNKLGVFLGMSGKAVLIACATVVIGAAVAVPLGVMAATSPSGTGSSQAPVQVGNSSTATPQPQPGVSATSAPNPAPSSSSGGGSGSGNAGTAPQQSAAEAKKAAEIAARQAAAQAEVDRIVRETNRSVWVNTKARLEADIERANTDAFALNLEYGQLEDEMNSLAARGMGSSSAMNRVVARMGEIPAEISAALDRADALQAELDAHLATWDPAWAG